MSQNFDESPVSDSKMDISESATSQENSTGVSPVNDLLLMNEIRNTNSCDLLTPTNKKESFTDKFTLNTTKKSILTNNIIQTMNAENQSEHKLNNIKLDNDNILNCLKFGNEISTELDNGTEQENGPQSSLSNSSSFRSSELTLANSHPLMSPPGTDSDSENGAASLANKRNIFSFPDVVPESEPMRLVPQHCPPVVNNKTKQFDTGKSSTNQVQLSKSFSNRTPAAIETFPINSELNFVNKPKKTVQYPRKLHNQHYNIVVQASSSPDIISSSGESEPDLSQYQATVEPNLQAVSLVNQKLETNVTSKLKKIPISAELLNDDISDSVSNHSFDDPNDEPNLASLSPSSSFDDFGGDYDDDLEYDCDLETPTSNVSQQPNNTSTNEPIPTYSVAEERRDSRNWQKITLPDGKVREIDMRVVEPYKRVLSHGGYLKAGGHNAIVMFCACFLPDRSRTDYHYVMDNLFLYVVKTLEQLVTEDYVLIYLHGGSTRRNTPPFPWLKKCYQLLDRRLRKSLKHMYLVHPTFWLKSVVCLSRPFVSSKFWRKLIYVNSLDELYSKISVEKTSIPDKVKSYDTKYK